MNFTGIGLPGGLSMHGKHLIAALAAVIALGLTVAPALAAYGALMKGLLAHSCATGSPWKGKLESSRPDAQALERAW